VNKIEVGKKNVPYSKLSIINEPKDMLIWGEHNLNSILLQKKKYIETRGQKLALPTINRAKDYPMNPKTSSYHH